MYPLSPIEIQEAPEKADGSITAEQWLFGPCPWSRCEEYGTRQMTAVEIGQHWEYCRDMQERHNWTALHIVNGKFNSYALLDSHGTLYSILSF